jgi:hypothetical protein
MLRPRTSTLRTWRTVLCGFALLAALAAAPAPTQAGIITGLFNTGVDDQGNPLPDFATDPHYTITSSPIGADSVLARSSANGFPVPPWVGDDSASKWIIPANTDADGDGPVGIYIYQTTFTVTGDPSTVAITGRYSSDNELINVLVNGVFTGIHNGTVGNDQGQYRFWWNLGTIAGLFQTGTNTIDFFVNNDGGPTGFRAELSAVPEPSSLVLGSVGSLLLLGYACRRRLATS